MSETNEWKRDFQGKIKILRERAGQRFEAFAQEVVDPIFLEFSDFTSRQGFQCSTPQAQNGTRSFKFALAEDGFALTFFRPKGMSEVEFDFECYVPGQGKVQSKRLSVSLAEGQREWVQRCFESALDGFVDAFEQVDSAVPEPVLV